MVGTPGRPAPGRGRDRGLPGPARRPRQPGTTRTGAGSSRARPTGPSGETLDDAIARFGACREATLRRVGALDEAGWSRSGTHETYGVLDVGGLLRLAYDHDLDHLATLERMAGGEASGGVVDTG